MIHQPSGGFRGQATDIEIHAQEIIKTRKNLNEIYARTTGKSVDTVNKAMERDNFMSPVEAKIFGLIDHIIEQRDNK